MEKKCITCKYCGGDMLARKDVILAEIMATYLSELLMEEVMEDISKLLEKPKNPKKS
jgi:hypothetical protein